ncbi:HlyD family efflux transporter periplasmic adaptor subunit [Bacillus sp. FJAT-29790]|uniref:HlyD family secretion protein n=1 Tax=Bacillus sp. FJAT-29790 TaxID=1895002 RepID=UPI001C220682|nr:HlyD family efflux transporter periplasmic adaptor subunit [Bacillus sp. FJAT-29790]MBU8878512.1 HlyD family efflux transporter periplasmic adaptor subunit [Bacillus sp. FJAT-29790]
MKNKWMYLLIISLMIMAGCSVKVSNLMSKKGSENLTLTGDIQNNIISATSTVSGKITEMNKEQGEPVKKGDIIAVIDPTNQKYVVDQLQAVVHMKKAKLEELQAGSRPQQIEQAQAHVRAIEAKLEELQAGTRPQQIEQAQANVRAAKAQLDLVTSGNKEEQIEQAKNNVSIAQEALNSQQITYNFENTQYNKALTLYNEGIIPKNELDQVELKLDTAAKQLSSLEYQLENAKQQQALLQKGSTSQEISVAKANYDAANAQLKLLQSGATKQAISAARAELDQANAQLKLLRSGATDQTISAAQAELDQAVAQLKQGENTLNNYTIVALEDGIIISKNFELGDVVNIGSVIADVAVVNEVYVVCYIPTEYLDKIYYNQEVSVKTSLGIQTGKLNFIALKNEYTPKDKQSTSDSKRIATKIKVAIDDQKGKLKSGMTADVEIPLN